MKANKDVFYDVFTNKPHHVSIMCPFHVQGCELLEGVFGTVGSKICWTYTLEGKEKISKQATLHIETKGEIDLVSWTMEYERPNENVPELINLLDFIIGMTKAVDDHHVKMN
ncbi:hypothetical protein KY290_035597 [Solanum tuberosum]|uniref:Bet v I/Major latex protein domain-containing protein n=1 Tax=Solanum tuberosum TaxID=4113 RepID=A0ABQ7TS01_SOLTU|nr:hypothetical protein KY290_035597 [Solanum tuberosum]